MANDTSAPHDRAAEVERLLDSDETMLGRFWQYEKLGLTPQEMAEQEETATFGWVYNCRRLVRVLRDGEVPTAPAVAQQAARKVKSLAKEQQEQQP